MTIESAISTLIGSRIAEAWPGTTLATEPTPLTGGFWASMYRLRLDGQPRAVPTEVVFRIAPDAAMGAKELAVQQAVAELGFPTPRVRLTRPVDDELGGAWSIMDFAPGTPPLGDLNGIAALRSAPALFTRVPGQLADPMAALHTLDPDREAILYDPQTSGGLLIAASERASDQVAAALAAAGVPASRIGSVTAARPGVRIVVRP